MEEQRLRALGDDDGWRADEVDALGVEARDSAEAPARRTRRIWWRHRGMASSLRAMGEGPHRENAHARSRLNDGLSGPHRARRWVVERRYGLARTDWSVPRRCMRAEPSATAVAIEGNVERDSATTSPA